MAGFKTGVSQPKVIDLHACATVIIPALNEAKHIAEVVAYALADPATAQVIVIDDSSVDDTVNLARSAGATVLTSSMLGKGASMQDGVRAACTEILVYLDGDLTGLQGNIVSDLSTPLLRGEADFVKAQFGRSGGRVTELTAKPMLKIFFPEVSHFSQPLGGIISARKSLLTTFTFEEGYGVDVGLLLDAYLAGARLAAVDIGSIEHDSQPLDDLALMASEVGRVIFNRAKVAGRLHVEQIADMYESQRQALAGIDYAMTKRRGRRRLLLLDMDGTITHSRYAVALARATGHESELMQLIDDDADDAVTRSDKVARLFRYIHKKKFEEVAHALEIRPGVIDFVNRMRRAGFMVGVVSDSYFIAAEIIRRRIFADFALAHTLDFSRDVCTGKVNVNAAFLENPDDPSSNACKSHILQRFLSDKTAPPIHTCWVVGDNVNDLGMMRLADQAFAIEPKSDLFRKAPNVTVIGSFHDLVDRVPDFEGAETAAA